MGITIRLYQERDLEACRDLWRELTQRHREIYSDPSIGGDDPARRFASYMETPNLAGPWVAEEEGQETVGMAGLLVNGREAEIEPVVVRSQYRSRGIGTRLIERLKAEARERGVDYLTIRPVARNVEAIACFHRAGFGQLGHIEMLIDMSGRDPREWRGGVTIHGHDFRY